MEITYQFGIVPATEAVVNLYDSSTINRPTHDKERIISMYANSNLVVTAWDGDLLVGVARSLTDFSYFCYLSDLAVRLEYQHSGIGKQLVYLTREKLGEKCMLLLLAAPAAINYYAKIGMNKVDNGFILNVQNKKYKRPKQYCSYVVDTPILL